MRKDLLPTTFEGKLAKVTEECGEVLKEIGKLQRFGVIAFDHGSAEELISPPNRYDNGEKLRDEMAQLRESMEILDRALRYEIFQAELKLGALRPPITERTRT